MARLDGYGSAYHYIAKSWTQNSSPPQKKSKRTNPGSQKYDYYIPESERTKLLNRAAHSYMPQKRKKSFFQRYFCCCS